MVASRGLLVLMLIVELVLTMKLLLRVSGDIMLLVFVGAYIVD